MPSLHHLAPDEQRAPEGFISEQLISRVPGGGISFTPMPVVLMMKPGAYRVKTRLNWEGNGRPEEKSDPQKDIRNIHLPAPQKSGNVGRAKLVWPLFLACRKDNGGEVCVEGLQLSGPKLSMAPPSPFHPLTSAVCSLQTVYSHQ